MVSVQDAGRGAGCGVLAGFREEFHSCLTARPDALFELAEAVLCAEGRVSSLVRLCLEPEFRRGHGSLYEALAAGRIDEDRLREALVRYRPAGWPLIFAVDESTVERCDAETSPGRGYYYHPSKHSAGQPIVAGWSYQWICQLSGSADSWTAAADIRRIHPAESTVAATVAQIRGLLGRLPATGEVPLFVFDAGYDPIALSYELASDRAGVLVRIKSDRVFHGRPGDRDAHGRRPGRPLRHGRRFACGDPATWGEPEDHLTTGDARYGTVTARAWSRLHPKLTRRGHWAGHPGLPPIVEGTVIRIDVSRLPRPSSRAGSTTLWLWHAGPHRPDLGTLWRAYLRRFDIEHTLRFAKNTLGWTAPGVRHPEQADRWTWLIAAALTQLRLTRPLAQDHRMPWEKPLQQHKLTPARIRRGFRRTRAHLPVITAAAKPSRPGPGRPRGQPAHRAPRHPAIKKPNPRP